MMRKYAKYAKNLIELMLLELGVATNGQLPQESATENGEEIANVHGHDGQHPMIFQPSLRRLGVDFNSQ